MTKNTSPKPTAPTKTVSVPKPTHVRTKDGYKCLSAGLAGPANPVVSETDGARLKAVLFGS